MKWLKIILIAVPVLVLAVVLILFARLDSIVRSTVESQASEQLSVPAKLGSARVGLFSGSLNLSEFNLGSPAGFDTSEMFQLGSVDAKVTYNQLRETPIRINSIDINKPKLVLEQKAMKFNVKALIDQLPPSEPTTETVRMIIDELRISGAQVQIKPGIPGVPPEINVNVPSLNLKNIGNADGAANGAAIKDVVITVITQLARAAAESDQIPPELRDLLRGDLQAVIDEKAKAVQGELQKAAEDVLKDPSKAKEVGKDLEKGLKDLIPQKPKKDN
jgi:hypothetical protein